MVGFSVYLNRHVFVMETFAAVAMYVLGFSERLSIKIYLIEIEQLYSSI